MRLEDLEIYQLAMKLGDDIWDIVLKWSFFFFFFFGKQWTDAADSIAANISEGYGRLSAKVLYTKLRLGFKKRRIEV